MDAYEAQLKCAKSKYPNQSAYLAQIEKDLDSAKKGKYPPCTPKSPKPGGKPPPGGGQHGSGGFVGPVKPQDPNAKTGPAGFGPNHAIGAASLVAYRIDFENEPRASAPAQFVQITDQLDPNLDWSTFELTELGFGDTFIVVPASSKYFATVVPMTFQGRSFEA